MKRAIALVLVGGAAVFAARSSTADVENQLFSSKSSRIRMVIPRNWRVTDQPSYPGLLLSLLRDSPDGAISLTVEPFTCELYRSWPVTCRTSRDSLASRYACAIRAQLETQQMKVGPSQSGPKENDAAGIPSVWFEADDGKHFLRQAIAMNGDRAVSLVLSTSTADARSTYARAFDQALRTLEPIGETAAGSGSGSGSGAGSGATGTSWWESGAVPKVNPANPCEGRR